jgi:glucokinase
MLDSQITRYEYVGIDIGGTNTRIGLFSSLETPHFELLAKFPTSQSYQQQLQTLITSIGNLGMLSLAGVGVSIAGRINYCII